MKQTRTRRKKQGEPNDFLTVLLFYVLPFIVINSIIFYLFTAKPKIEITVSDTEDYLTTTATVTIHSLLPTKDLSISQDGQAIQPEAAEGKTYTVPITSNGVLEVSVKNFNGMSAAEFCHINLLDDAAPTVRKYTLDDDGIITIALEDTQSGVDLETVYAIDSEGAQSFPISQDNSAGEVQFEMDSQGLTLHAKDFTGNELLVTFTSHMDGSEEVLDSIEGTETTIRPGEQAETEAASSAVELTEEETESTEEE